MKKVTVRVLRLADIVDPVDGGILGEKLELVPGEFYNDAEASASIQQDGKYIVLPVYEHVTEKKEA